MRVTPSRLQTVALPIVPDHECKQAYGDNLAETMICAGYREGGKSVCQVSTFVLFVKKKKYALNSLRSSFAAHSISMTSDFEFLKRCMLFIRIVPLD